MSLQNEHNKCTQKLYIYGNGREKYLCGQLKKCLSFHDTYINNNDIIIEIDTK